MARGRPKRRKGMAVRRSMSGRRGRQPLGNAVEEAIVHLRHVRSAVLVAVAALRRQNCELDEDIATLLQRCACDRLADQLERLEAARRLPFPRLRRV